MQLQSLQLAHFRNFEQQKLNFHPQFNFIFGKNAQGKTNIMEAIYYLAELKSFRTNDKSGLIQKQQDFAKVLAHYQKDNLNWDIEIVLNQKSRKVLVNGKKPKTRKDYYEMIPLVLFEPRDIYLFRDSPSKRRKYLNRALFIQDANFLKLLSDYEKIITQKNKVLKDFGHNDLLDVWNYKVAELGSEIIHLRPKWFLSLHEFLEKEYKEISKTNESFHLKYKVAKDVINPQEDYNLSKEDIRQKLTDKLSQNLQHEINRRESLVGPHRDDFIAYLDDREIGEFGSQGENRSAIIALKMAQLKMFSAKYQKTPLFLLDDVASELDQYRCEYLFSYLRDERSQVFLTTTENSHISSEFTGKSASFLVEAGSISGV